MNVYGIGHSQIEMGVAEAVAELVGGKSVNLGRSGFTSRGIVALLGADPCPMTIEGGLIPATGPVRVHPMGDWAKTPSGPCSKFQSTPETVLGSLGGVEGMLCWDGDALTFLRNEEGAAVKVSNDHFHHEMLVLSTGQPVVWRPGIAIVSLGRNNYDDHETVVRDTKSVVSYLTALGVETVVLGELNARFEEAGWEPHRSILDLNRRLASAFPLNYCRLGGLDNRDALVASFDPNDPTEVADGQRGIPASRLMADDLHHSGEGIKICARHVAAFIAERRLMERVKARNWSQGQKVKPIALEVLPDLEAIRSSYAAALQLGQVKVAGLEDRIENDRVIARQLADVEWGIRGLIQDTHRDLGASRDENRTLAEQIQAAISVAGTGVVQQIIEWSRLESHRVDNANAMLRAADGVISRYLHGSSIDYIRWGLMKSTRPGSAGQVN